MEVKNGSLFRILLGTDVIPAPAITALFILYEKRPLFSVFSLAVEYANTEVPLRRS